MHFMHNLLKNLSTYAKRPLFKQYVDASAPSWTSISYETYLDDLNNAAGYWKHHLEQIGVQKTDVVGVW